METKDKFKSSYKTEVPTNSVPHWPQQCQLCGSETAVALVIVYDDSGTCHRGAFTQFGRIDKTRAWVLNNPYTYSGWLTRCANHYGMEALG